jgi:hypothetical protein
MKNSFVIASVAIVFCSASNLAMAAEPNEAEMRGAIQKELDLYYQNSNALADGCEQIRESDNPFVAIGCMIGKTRQMANISITSFEKIGCGKARAAGYVCDYRVKVSTGGLLGPLDNMGGGINTKRFVKTSDGWMLAN